MTTASKTLSTPKAPAVAKAAIALHKADHAAVCELFEDYENTDSSKKRRPSSPTICAELNVHTQIEEEIFTKTKTSSLDLVELGVRMATRKMDFFAARGRRMSPGSRSDLGITG